MISAMKHVFFLGGLPLATRKLGAFPMNTWDLSRKHVISCWIYRKMGGLPAVHGGFRGEHYFTPCNCGVALSADTGYKQSAFRK